MRSSTVGRSLLLTAAVIGCGFAGFGCVRAPIKPPEYREVDLGILKAPNRDYAAAGIEVCDVDPKIVAAEARATNEALGDFLERTKGGPQAGWSDEQLRLLERGHAELPDAVAVYEKTLAGMTRCEGKAKHDFAVIAGRGQELVAAARERAASAPELIRQVRRHQAISSWRRQEEERREQEKRNWCPPKPKVIPDVYYAWQDETGRIEWVFCDETRVVTRVGSDAWDHVPPPEELRKNSPSIQTPAGYIKAAKRFPDSEIRRPPSFDERGSDGSGAAATHD